MKLSPFMNEPQTCLPLGSFLTLDQADKRADVWEKVMDDRCGKDKRSDK